MEAQQGGTGGQPAGASATPGADAAADAVAALDAALELFARRGYAETKLDAVAQQAGISKRMIHYHFGDKRGLYVRALALAEERLTPPTEVLERSSAVPVDGMRRFIDALFHTFLDHPDCVRLLLRENLAPALDADESEPSQRDNVVSLHAERLLLLGQDAGAFRPGISAHDLLALVVSLCEFHVAHGHDIYAAGRVDFRDRRNVDGMRRMVIDTVLAFLTSNIAYSGYESYLRPATGGAKPQPASPQVYEVEAPGIY